jgi:hypothetical protein
MIVNLTAIDFDETAVIFKETAEAIVSYLLFVTPKGPTQEPLAVTFYRWLERIARKYSEGSL